jgi:DNA-directed RNA polymerase specialized sigma24 family protein
MFPGDEEDQPGIPEPPADDLNPELRSEAVRFWNKLSIEDRSLLRLVVQSGKSTAEIAAAVRMTQAQVYSSIYRIRKEMPDWFKTPAGESKKPSGSVQTEIGSDEG